MSTLSAIQSDLGEYIVAHQRIMASPLLQEDSSGNIASVLDHSLCLTRQLAAAVDALDISGALHTTFCQTVNVLHAYHYRTRADAGTSPEQERGRADCQSSSDRNFASIAISSEEVRKRLPWLSILYRRYCDELWSAEWRDRSSGSAPGTGYDCDRSGAVAVILTDIACDFVQLTEKLLDPGVFRKALGPLPE